MLALVLAVCCSLGIGMIFKHGAERQMDRVALLTVNYAVAFGVALALATYAPGGAAGGPGLAGGLVVLGLTTGALFIFGFFVLSLATERAGLGLAIGVMRVSVVIPFLASWVIWSEVPTAAQGAGLALACGAFFLIAMRGPRSGAVSAETASAGAGSFAVLALLFLSGGIVDVLMKTFDEVFAPTYSRAAFLTLVFGVAFGLGLVFVLRRRLREGVWPRRDTVLWGIGLGIINYGSAEFILQAIEQLSGPFVFPANNIALVIGAALIGVTVWNERLSRLNVLGLALAAVALWLLSMGRV